MDLEPSSDEMEIVDSVDRFLGEQLGVEALRDRMRAGTGVSPAEWRKAGEIGLFSLGLPESSGGAGFSIVDEALVFRQVGRHLAPVTFVAGVIAAKLADRAGLTSLRDEIASGSAPVGLAVGAAGATVGAAVSGEYRVLDGSVATCTLAMDADGALALVPAATFGDHRELEPLDPSSMLSISSVEGVEAIAHDGAGAAGPLSLAGSLMCSAMLSGIADSARDMAASYATERVQFGRPIGVNQAIKHRCADMAVECEAAQSQLYFAAVALRDERPDAVFQVAAARRIAAHAALENARGNVQVHGGMGYTYEHDAHLYVTRCHVIEFLFGGEPAQQGLLLDREPAPL